MITRYSGLKEKYILLTGSEGILGQELLKHFLEQKANLLLVDIFDNAHKYKSIDRVNYFKCDISKKSQINLLFQEIEKISLTIDVLINNAATKTNSLEDFFQSFENYTIETWREVMGVNLDGAFLISQMAQNFLMKSSFGASVIQVSSIYGVVSPDNRIYDGAMYLNTKINSPAIYSASKAALIGLTKYLSTYWGKYNIRVNSISPGGIESGQNDQFIKKYSDRVPLKRMAAKEEISRAILFLASNDSTYINGQNIIVDGGLTAW
tara:strand:- start:861 stop:1655 length:795 start_codon:yes stop_codon:yes gene_type:complete